MFLIQFFIHTIKTSIMWLVTTTLSRGDLEHSHCRRKFHQASTGQRWYRLRIEILLSAGSIADRVSVFQLAPIQPRPAETLQTKATCSSEKEGQQVIDVGIVDAQKEQLQRSLFSTKPPQKLLPYITRFLLSHPSIAMCYKQNHFLKIKKRNKIPLQLISKKGQHPEILYILANNGKIYIC